MSNVRPGLTFSHFGVFARDLARMEAFYTDMLGFTVTDRGRIERPAGTVDLVFLSRDPDEHHQIVLASGRPEEIGFNVINQISLKADSLPTLQALFRRLRDSGVTGLAPITHGNALSVYAPDPEGNRLELYVDLPWYVTQPVVMPVDLDRDAQDILNSAEAHARSLPGFMPREQWRAEMARRMGLSA